VFLHKILSFAKDILIPSVCCSCGNLSAQAICLKCLHAIERHADPLCLRCGHPLNEKDPLQKGCIYCRQKDLHFFRLRSYGPYRDVLKDLIISYRYRGIEMLSDLLVSFFAELFQRHYCDEEIHCMETVPSLMQEEKGYRPDQPHPMQKIAAKLAIFLDLPYSDNMIKISNTSRQQVWDFSQKASSLAGCFKVKNSLCIENRNILLIDDVMMGDAMLNEVSLLLKRAGADKIFLLTIAIAM
jgi:predicted amidophosphoribosyltransferase